MPKLSIFASMALLVAACGSTERPQSRLGAAVGEAVPSAPVLDTGSASEPFSTGTSPAPTTAAPPVDAAYEWSSTPIDETNLDTLASTWRDGCPVHFEDLTLVELTHWNYEGEPTVGRLVIARTHVETVVDVFGRLFDAGFPIDRMELIEEYDGDDQASMVANNSSAFNCREIAGSPGVWSQHAYGGAIDLNPLVNPWVQDDRIDPPEGAEFADRDLDVPGLIRPGDVVTEAFAAEGWGWGGDWIDSRDYQHFSWNGR